ncbi:hypothetical protein FRC11_011149 [Ceratobasidium sp. 423]|nr:hypothetical protein FRC11_011149 [Ceratobasidium sp. 423]
MITSYEEIYDEFPTVIAGTLVTRQVKVTRKLTNRLTKYFGTMYLEMGFDGVNLRTQIDFNTLVQYGRFRLAGDGDHIHMASSIENDPDRGAWDNSFMRQYDLLPDANASHEDLLEVQARQTYYGQVLDIYYVEFVMDLK